MHSFDVTIVITTTPGGTILDSTGPMPDVTAVSAGVSDAGAESPARPQAAGGAAAPAVPQTPGGSLNADDDGCFIM